MKKDLVACVVIFAIAIAAISTYTFFHSEPILSREKQNIRFVLFSCLHVGETAPTEINRAANYIRQLKPSYLISAGDFLTQDRNPFDPQKNDEFMETYLDFLRDTGMKPGVNVFHISGGVHDGWSSIECRYYDGMFRKLYKYSDMDVVKIGNLAFMFISEVRGGEKYRVTASQLQWFESKVEELSLQRYNIFLVKHTSLYRTTAYTDRDRDAGVVAWYGVATSTNREESDAIKSIVNQYENVIMVIQGHVHIDATDKDAVGRPAFMNWKKVYGDPHYLGIKAHVLNCAGISTTMHANQYKSYQNVWFMDFTEGQSYFDLYAHNIETGQELLHYKISLLSPFESDSPKYEQQWSPCFLDYPKIKYPNSLSATYKIYVRANATTFFKAKFKFDESVAVKGINVVASGKGAITKMIAYSDDGITFSSFTSNFPASSHKYWMLKIDIVADTQIEIYDVNLTLR